MTEFLQNPRRSPRAPVRCRTAVNSGVGTFEATTEDVGGHGCQIVSPRLVRKGEPVQLVISHESMKAPLQVAGRVAWASERAPWRLGIAYDDSALPASQAWFDGLLSNAPDVAAFRKIPDKIPVDAVVYLATPPRFLADFTPDEVAILRAVGSGTSVAELRSLLRDRWPGAQRALFSLLAHPHVTLTRGASVHPDAWRKLLSEAEASLAVESLRRAPVPELTAAPPAPARPRVPAPAPAVPAPSPSPSPVADWATALHAAPAPPPDPGASPPGNDKPDWLVTAAEMMPAVWSGAAAAPPAPQPAAPPPPPARAAGTPTPAVRAAGTPTPAVPSRAGSSTRSAEAQGCYESALVEMAAGRMGGAMALLRRALALAPGDPEIASAFARCMKR